MEESVKKYSILIVEDEPIVGKVCRRILESSGYTVTLVVNGLEAKNLVNKNRYDFCLSDIKTPVMNGMELYTYLKKSYPALADKMVLMTGDVMNKDIGKFLEENKTPYILKPFTDTQLLATVNEYLK